MKLTVIILRTVLAASLMLSAYGCDQGGNAGGGTGGGGGGGLNTNDGTPFVIDCDPNTEDVSETAGLFATVDLHENDPQFDEIENQEVEITFGSAVISAKDLFSSDVLDPNGALLVTGPGGFVGVLIECDELGNNANPCTVTFKTTFKGTTKTCTTRYI